MNTGTGAEAFQTEENCVENLNTDEAPDSADPDSPEYNNGSSSVQEEQEPGAQATEGEIGEQNFKTPGVEPTDGYLKIVITTRNGRAMIGVERTYADPYMESVPGDRIEDIAAVLPEAVQRAKDLWSVRPRHPDYFRPAQQVAKKSGRKNQAKQQTPSESAGENTAPAAAPEAAESPLLL